MTHNGVNSVDDISPHTQLYLKFRCGVKKAKHLRKSVIYSIDHCPTYHFYLAQLLRVWQKIHPSHILVRLWWSRRWNFRFVQTRTMLLFWDNNNEKNRCHLVLRPAVVREPLRSIYGEKMVRNEKFSNKNWRIDKLLNELCQKRCLTQAFVTVYCMVLRHFCQFFSFYYETVSLHKCNWIAPKSKQELSIVSRLICYYLGEPILFY